MAILTIITQNGIRICLGDVDSEEEAEEVTKEWIQTHPTGNCNEKESDERNEHNIYL